VNFRGEVSGPSFLSPLTGVLLEIKRGQMRVQWWSSEGGIIRSGVGYHSFHDGGLETTFQSLVDITDGEKWHDSYFSEIIALVSLSKMLMG
jgi:hypothetical protein